MTLRAMRWLMGGVGMVLALMGGDIAWARPLLPVETLEILRPERGAVVARFTVEIADTPETRERGLMGREHLDADRGMLFRFGRPLPIMMWMRKTSIPLDMLFVDAQGVIRHIHHRARPFDETIIASPVRVPQVLEVLGGQSAALGVQVGDIIRTCIGKKACEAW